MLKNITLDAYRAYAKKTTFDFSIPENGKIGLTILVGQNNAGKSTPLNLLKVFFSEEPDIVFDRESRHSDRKPEFSAKYMYEHIEVVFKTEAADNIGAYAIKETHAPLAPNRDQIFNLVRRKFRYVPSRRAWSDRFSRQYRADFNQLEDQLYRSARNQEAPLGQLLAKIIFEERKEDFDAILKRIVPEVTDWTIDAQLDQDTITYVTKSKKMHSISSLGDGFVSVFRLAYTLFSSNPGDTIILDEPELSLHPEAQKSLHRLLSEISLNRQVIIATHSPYMVNWSDIDRGAIVYRLSLDSKGNVMVGKVSPSTFSRVKGAVTSDYKNRKLFDVLAKEIFFRNTCVFCEGQEDVHLLDAYMEQQGVNLFPMFGYGSGGAPMMKSWLALASELNVKAAAIFDRDASKIAEECRAAFARDSNIGIFVHDHGDIRDKHLRDGNCTKNGSCNEVRTSAPVKTGYFDAKGNIKAGEKERLDRFLGRVRRFLEKSSNP